MTKNRSSAQTFAMLVGVVFLLVGILGFVPGIVVDHDSKFIGQDGDSELLGIFQINILHNLVHLIFGVVGLLAAKAAGPARQYLIVGGAVYLVVFLYGIVIDFDSSANIINLNSADNVLHLALGAGMIGLGLISGDRAAAGHDHRSAVA